MELLLFTFKPAFELTIPYPPTVNNRIVKLRVRVRVRVKVKVKVKSQKSKLDPEVGSVMGWPTTTTTTHQATFFGQITAN